MAADERMLREYYAPEEWQGLALVLEALIADPQPRPQEGAVSRIDGCSADITPRIASIRTSGFKQPVNAVSNGSKYARAVNPDTHSLDSAFEKSHGVVERLCRGFRCIAK